MCDESAVKAQQILITESKDIVNDATIKRQVHIRFSGVPAQIDQLQVGELVSTSGITVRMSHPTILKLIQRYLCKKCEHVTVVEVSLNILFTLFILNLFLVILNYLVVYS